MGDRDLVPDHLILDGGQSCSLRQTTNLWLKIEFSMPMVIIWGGKSGGTWLMMNVGSLGRSG